MLMMRLQRIGRKNDPSFRVVVTDKRNGPRAGNHVDTIGSYNPKLSNFQIDEEKAKHWLSKGVQPSDTIYNFLISKGIIEGKKRNVLPRKSPVVAKKSEEETTDETPAEETDTKEEVTEEAPVEDVPVEEEKKEEEKPKETEEVKEETPSEDSAPEETDTKEKVAEDTEKKEEDK